MSGTHLPHAPRCYLQSIGTAVPARSFTSEQTVAEFGAVYTEPRSQRLLRRIVRLTGIENRYLAALDFLDRNGDGRRYMCRLRSCRVGREWACGTRALPRRPGVW